MRCRTCGKPINQKVQRCAICCCVYCEGCWSKRGFCTHCNPPKICAYEGCEEEATAWACGRRKSSIRKA